MWAAQLPCGLGNSTFPLAAPRMPAGPSSRSGVSSGFPGELKHVGEAEKRVSLQVEEVGRCAPPPARRPRRPGAPAAGGVAGLRTSPAARARLRERASTVAPISSLILETQSRPHPRPCLAGACARGPRRTFEPRFARTLTSSQARRTPQRSSTPAAAGSPASSSIEPDQRDRAARM